MGLSADSDSPQKQHEFENKKAIHNPRVEKI